MFRSLMLVGVVLASSRAALAQDSNNLIPHDRDASAQVAKIVASAEAAGLPTSAIVSKVRFGVSIAKAKPDSIVAAANVVATRLEIARVALAPNPTQPDIEAGANALGAKATPDALKAVRKASGNRPMATALGVLTQLLTNDVPVKRATDIVTELIRRNASPNQLIAYGNDVAGEIATGTTAVAAADAHARGLIAVLAAPGGVNAETALDAPAFGTAGSQAPGRSAPPRPRRP